MEWSPARLVRRQSEAAFGRATHFYDVMYARLPSPVMPEKRRVNRSASVLALDSIAQAYIDVRNNDKRWLNEELNADLASGPFAAYVKFTNDSHTPPKVLITTSSRASKPTYGFSGELVGVYP